MTLISFAFSMLGFAYVAGLLGSLTGLGGGIIITPILVLFFHVDIHYAMGTSLISVIVTSSGAAIGYLREGYTNIRIGMLLEVAAVIGAFVGALSITKVPIDAIAIIFGVMLIVSAYFSLRQRSDTQVTKPSHAWALALNLPASRPTRTGLKAYSVQRVPLALGLMVIAGALSSLLGIGSGVLKVLAMDQAMGLPYRVSTATSNFIIGITAAVSAGVYVSLGYVDPLLTFPIILGVLAGAMSGAKVLTKINTQVLRVIFSSLIFGVAIQMMYKGITGAL